MSKLHKIPVNQQHIRTVEERLQEDLQEYRGKKVELRRITEMSYISIPTNTPKSNIFPDLPPTIERHVPDMPERVLTSAEREALIQVCLKQMSTTWGQSLVHNLLQTYNDFIDFCHLMQKPENHIKIASGQYVEKHVHVRTVHDMSDEMAQELSRLPRFTAWVNLIEESDGEQLAVQKKIYTLPLTRVTPQITESELLEESHDLCMKRTEIEAEIRQRQEKWRSNGSSPQESPPDDTAPPTRM